MEQMLITDCVGYTMMDLNEAAKTSSSGALKFRGKFQEHTAVNKNRRQYPESVLKSNVKRLEEAIKNRGLLGELDHPCLVDKNFEVLTPSGWKEFKEIRTGDTVYSRVNGQMIESVVKDVIDNFYDGKCYEVKGRGINCTFTAPHKFLMCNRKNEEHYNTLEEIHNNRTKYSHHYIPKTAQWQGRDEKTITLKSRQRKFADCQEIQVDTDKLMTFLGLYLAEGCCVKRNNSNRVVICQKNSYGRDLIKKLLTDFHPEITWQETKEGFCTHDARLHDFVSGLGNKYQKYIPTSLKSLGVKYLEKLLLGFMIGDGRMLKSDGKTCLNMKKSLSEITLDTGKWTRLSMFSVSEQLVDDLHECLIKCGFSGSREIINTEKDYEFAGRIIKAENKKPLHVLNVQRSKGIHLDPRFLKTIEGHHTGRIYCLTTEHGNFYMKYKGKSFWTGNCDSIIHFENASHLVTKLWWEGNALMGEGEVLSTPAGKLLKSLIESGVRVGISSRGVGNGQTNEEGVLVIGESYKLITFDAVADPSTFAAFQQKVESVIPTPVKVAEKKHVNPKALISFFGQMLEAKTNEIKTKIK